MHKSLAMLPALILASCGNQTPESMEAPVAGADENVPTLPSLAPTADETSDPAESTPTEVIDDSTVQEDTPDEPEVTPDAPVDEVDPDDEQAENSEPDLENTEGDDVIEPSTPPDLYMQSSCIHEWRDSPGTAIAPNPFNVCTMQITWDMAEGHTYTLVLDGEGVPGPIESVWEFSIDQLGVESDLNIDLLPTVQVMTCNENHCRTSEILEWLL